MGELRNSPGQHLREQEETRGGADYLEIYHISGADVSRLVVMQGLRPALAGVGIGIVAAFFAVRLLRTLLFGVTPLDPLTFAIVPPALLAVAALACYVPALRAVRLDPTRALRAG